MQDDEARDRMEAEARGAVPAREAIIGVLLKYEGAISDGYHHYLPYLWRNTSFEGVSPVVFEDYPPNGDEMEKMALEHIADEILNAMWINVERWDAEQKADKATVYIPVAPETEQKPQQIELETAAGIYTAARHEENCTCEICFDRPSRHC